MSSATRTKIISYLGQGVSKTVTAEACGVSASYVSQLLEEEGVLKEIAVVRASKLQRDMEVDDSIATIEKDALAAVGKRLAYVKGPLEAARIFQILNASRRRSEASKLGDDAAESVSVTLVLPRAANVMIEVNTDQQVVAVNGMSIAPLPSKHLPGLAARLLPKSGVIDIPSVPEVRRLEPHVLAQQKKQQEADKKRAASIFDAMEVVHNGERLDI